MDDLVQSNEELWRVQGKQAAFIRSFGAYRVRDEGFAQLRQYAATFSDADKQAALVADALATGENQSLDGLARAHTPPEREVGGRSKYREPEYPTMYEFQKAARKLGLEDSVASAAWQCLRGIDKRNAYDEELPDDTPRYIQKRGSVDSIPRLNGTLLPILLYKVRQAQEVMGETAGMQTI